MTNPVLLAMAPNAVWVWWDPVGRWSDAAGSLMLNCKELRSLVHRTSTYHYSPALGGFWEPTQFGFGLIADYIEDHKERLLSTASGHLIVEGRAERKLADLVQYLREQFNQQPVG